MANRRDLGQPKAEWNPTPKYTYCVYPTFIDVVYPTSLNCKLEKKAKSIL